MSALCSERFFIHGADTPDNCCQRPKGHTGAHLTAMSDPQPDRTGLSIACSIRWGEAEPLKPLGLIVSLPPSSSMGAPQRWLPWRAAPS